MAQFAILLYYPAPADAGELSEEQRAQHDRHAGEIGDLGGSMVAAFALEPSTQARSVRSDLVTDGPFVEAREVVAGFYVVEAEDLDGALRIARRNPATWMGGGVEVRPVAGGFVAPAAG